MRFRHLALFGSVLLLTARASTPAAAQAVPACGLSAADVYERTAPGVVSILAMSIDPYSTSERIRQSVGTGIVLDAARGLVITNAHVVMGAQYATVTMSDGTDLPADLVGIDPVYDLAVLVIESPADRPLTALEFNGLDRVRVGEDVVAIGNPLGLSLTLSRGVVSAKHRVLPVAPFALSEPFIQTDAAINPGNSGGPLLNHCAEVVGINAAIIAGAQGIGFAIPASLAIRVAELLVRDGRVIRPWFGFQGQMVQRTAAALLRVPLVPGLLVEVVEPGSPAEEAGLVGGAVQLAIEGVPMLVGGDVITQINGRLVSDMEGLVEILRRLRVGDSIRLDVNRLGTPVRLEYVLPERPLLPMDLAGRAGVSEASDPKP